MQVNPFRPKAIIEQIDPWVLSQGEPWYLYNIYGMEHTRAVSTWGTYYIPPCPEEKEWIRSAQSIPGTYQENYAKFSDKEEYPARAIPGERVVQAVLAIENPLEDITRYGVFASQNERPTKSELEKATKKLETYLIALVQQADQYYSSVDGVQRESIRDNHWNAARRLRVTRPWMNVAEALAMCPFCDRPVKPGVPKCSHCHEIIDAKAYAALKAQIGA